MALDKLFRTTVFKISLAYLVISAIGAGIVLGSIGENIRTLLDEQIAQTVDADIAGLSEQYAQGGIRRLIDSIEKRARRPGAGLYLVTTFAGEPIAGNIIGLPPDLLNHPGLVETVYQASGGGPEKRRALARIFALPGGFRLLVGQDLEEGESLRHILGGALLTSLFWLVIIGTLGGLWVARRVLNRVDAINAKARRIVAGDLTGRLPLAGTGDELDRLVQNFNAMLDRIAELMAGLKEVSDNIAHDLKTPLTRLRSRAEQALRFAKSPEDYRGALEKVLEESDRLIQIFDALLMIARAEAGSGREGMSDFDAASVARDIGELYEPVAEEGGVALRISVEPDLILHGSRELVSQAVANLVDNALKYGGQENADGSADALAQEPNAGLPALAAKTVDLAARRRGDRVEISVADRGPGIPAQDRARVLDRFVRLENSRSRPGSGLGLSLAAAVARLHNGHLQIEDNAPGLRVVLSFPARPVSRAPMLLPPPERAPGAQEADRRLELSQSRNVESLPHQSHDDSVPPQPDAAT
ncbi:ATP-binding protein [Methylocapsa polymorpha]|uniref:histidine kinase n=1 Tax=Methylocapsa polymorpha TaxID=3080828 RepID=A0ABZ0HXP7_9HYPH|nr:ATP-binding protein [Methylocapsa sp. RX1]